MPIQDKSLAHALLPIGIHSTPPNQPLSAFSKASSQHPISEDNKHNCMAQNIDQRPQAAHELSSYGRPATNRLLSCWQKALLVWRAATMAHQWIPHCACEDDSTTQSTLGQVCHQSVCLREITHAILSKPSRTEVYICTWSFKSRRTLLEGAGRGVGAAEAGSIGAGGLGREGNAAAPVADKVHAHNGGQEAQHEAAAHPHLRHSIPSVARQCRSLRNREAVLL